jgi:hypothetical protein
MNYDGTHVYPEHFQKYKITTTDQLYYLIFNNLCEFRSNPSNHLCVRDDNYKYVFVNNSNQNYILSTETKIIVRNNNNQDITPLLHRIHKEMYKNLIDENKKWYSKKKINTSLILGMINLNKNFNETISHFISENGMSVRVNIQINVVLPTYITLVTPTHVSYRRNIINSLGNGHPRNRPTNKSLQLSQ